MGIGNIKVLATTTSTLTWNIFLGAILLSCGINDQATFQGKRTANSESSGPTIINELKEEGPSASLQLSANTPIIGYFSTGRNYKEFRGWGATWFRAPNNLWVYEYKGKIYRWLAQSKPDDSRYVLTGYAKPDGSPQLADICYKKIDTYLKCFSELSESFAKFYQPIATPIYSFYNWLYKVGLRSRPYNEIWVRTKKGWVYSNRGNNALKWNGNGDNRSYLMPTLAPKTIESNSFSWPTGKMAHLLNPTNNTLNVYHKTNLITTSSGKKSYLLILMGDSQAIKGLKMIESVLQLDQKVAQKSVKCSRKATTEYLDRKFAFFNCPISTPVISYAQYLVLGVKNAQGQTKSLVSVVSSDGSGFGRPYTKRFYAGMRNSLEIPVGVTSISFGGNSCVAIPGVESNSSSSFYSKPCYSTPKNTGTFDLISKERGYSWKSGYIEVVKVTPQGRAGTFPKFNINPGLARTIGQAIYTSDWSEPIKKIKFGKFECLPHYKSYFPRIGSGIFQRVDWRSPTNVSIRDPDVFDCEFTSQPKESDNLNFYSADIHMTSGRVFRTRIRENSDNLNHIPLKPVVATYQERPEAVANTYNLKTCTELCAYNGGVYPSNSRKESKRLCEVPKTGLGFRFEGNKPDSGKNGGGCSMVEDYAGFWQTKQYAIFNGHVSKDEPQINNICSCRSYNYHRAAFQHYRHPNGRVTFGVPVFIPEKD